MKSYALEQPVVSITVHDVESDTMGDEDLDPVVEALGEPERRPLLVRGVSALSVMGTVRLTDGEVVFVPPATADPRDPLNIKRWQKMTMVVVLFSAITMSLIGGFGGIINFYIPHYMAQGSSYPSITHLMTYPTLFMGLGNLIGMPLAIAVGRRIVLLMATVVLIIGAVMCATSDTLSVHFTGRMLIGLASGQSESLVPLMIQEIHFLHERARVLMVQQTVQVIFSAVWLLCASPIAEAISPAWWYGLGAVIASFVFCISIFLVPETKYHRDQNHHDHEGDQLRKSCVERPPLDFVNFEARTWRSDMRLWVGSPEWHRAREVLEHVFQLLFFPNIIWVMCLCGLALGINVSMATTYSAILQGDPYHWPNKYISYANFGQIPVAVFCFPLMGYAADKIAQWRARRNGGMHEPENRLLLLTLSTTIGVICCVMYGQGASHPYSYSWYLYPITLAGYFFAFATTVVISMTYLLDSYPTRAGPILIVVGASRGILSCLVSFNVARWVDKFGNDVTFAGFGLAYAGLGLIVIPMFIYGKRIRIFTSRWATSKRT